MCEALWDWICGHFQKWKMGSLGFGVRKHERGSLGFSKGRSRSHENGVCLKMMMCKVQKGVDGGQWHMNRGGGRVFL